jgi:hypothetical protein
VDRGTALPADDQVAQLLFFAKNLPISAFIGPRDGCWLLLHQWCRLELGTLGEESSIKKLFTPEGYGDTPNRLPMRELPTRFEILADHAHSHIGTEHLESGTSVGHAF